MHYLLRTKWDRMTVESGQMLETEEFDAAMPQQGIAVAFALFGIIESSRAIG